MKVLFLILTILVIWAVGFFAFEKLIKALSRWQRKERIKDILFDQADFKIVKMVGTDKLLFDGQIYDL